MHAAGRGFYGSARGGREAGIWGNQRAALRPSTDPLGGKTAPPGGRVPEAIWGRAGAYGCYFGMNFVQDAAMARVKANRALDEYDLLNFRLLYPAEVEGCCLLLDACQRCIRRYVAGPQRPERAPGFGLPGGQDWRRGNAPPFYLVSNVQKKGKRYLVLPEAGYCSCPYQPQSRGEDEPRVCKHLLACQILEAAGMRVPETQDYREYEDALYGALLGIAGSLPRARELF